MHFLLVKMQALLDKRSGRVCSGILACDHLIFSDTKFAFWRNQAEDVKTLFLYSRALFLPFACQIIEYVELFTLDRLASSLHSKEHLCYFLVLNVGIYTVLSVIIIRLVVGVKTFINSHV